MMSVVQTTIPKIMAPIAKSYQNPLSSSLLTYYLSSGTCTRSVLT